MKRNRIITMAALLLVAVLLVQAQTAREDFKRDMELAGDNYTAYQGPQKKLTEAPKGYKPCYISHYGRHGSRYLIGWDVYSKPIVTLQKADSAGMLTATGKALLERLWKITDDAWGRNDELTLRGAEQHQGIAQRMYDRFPGLFQGNVRVDAKSSTVIRCILSMANEIMELRAKNPDLLVRMDASAGDMQYINMNDKNLSRQRKPRGSEAQKAWDAFREEHFDASRFLNSIFVSEDYWRENIKNPYDFAVNNIWKLAADMQSTELRHSMSLLDLFTEEELYNIWLIRNAEWYITHGPSPLNGGTQIYSQRNLIKKIIEEADEALAAQQADATTGATGKADASQRTLTANLRFGHEVVLMPTVCFLNLNGYGTQYADLAELEQRQWYSYRIFPMGSNIQIVFYRSEKQADDVLVQFLLNEDEATIPDLKPAAKSCFYRWNDVRQYCLDKLAKYKED